MKHGKWLSSALALTLCTALAAQTFALGAGQSDFRDISETAVQNYENGEHELIKISHPDKKANTRSNKEKIADGIVDYLGDGKLALPGTAEGADGQGSRNQSYCWASVDYGDYMYVNTLFGAATQTAMMFPQAGNVDLTPEVMDKLTNVLYKGDLCLHEEDNGYSGCALVKINVKTGDTELIMSKEKGGVDPQFRNAIKYNGKLYFCGNPNYLPSIWEVDPETDQCREVYVDASVAAHPEKIMDAVVNDQLGVALRGMTEYQGRLIISCVGYDANPYIAVANTTDPADGFTKIASTYVEDPEATDNFMKPDPDPQPGELLGYPACRLTDSIYGGSIWEMTEFDGRLYVAMCTGTQDLSDGKKPGNAPMQSFAIMCGEPKPGMDLADRDAWTWRVVAGDEADGAKYTFGIDPERTRSGACCMKVFNDHLYIGEYNDSEVALIQMLADGFNSSFMADNLEQSVSLYRMDEDENMELVAGQPTKMFPKGSLSGLYSGFGEKRNEYSNQYIWQMKEFQDKLYIGTFDQTTLLYPLAQLSNGDILHWTPSQWIEQLNYMRELLESLLKKPETPDKPQVSAMLEAQDQAETLMAQEPVDVLSMPALLGEGDKITTPEDLHYAMSLLPAMLDQDESWTLEQKIAAKETFSRMYQEMYDGYEQLKTQLPPAIQDIYDKILNPHEQEIITSMARTLYYMKDAEAGFDLYVLSENKDGTVSIDTICKDGLGDPYNHGIRVFAANDSWDNPWLTLGTANMCYGTQVWRLEGDKLNRAPWVNPFQDVHEEDYFFDPVHWGVVNGITSGVEPTLFGPGRTCTRAEIVTFLWKEAGSPKPSAKTVRNNPFQDISKSDWYYNAVLWAYETGITAGTGKTEFGPLETCNRAQAMTMLWKHMDKPEADAQVPFTDVAETDWFYKPVQWAVDEGITAGVSDTEFGSLVPCSRAHILTFLFLAAVD